MDRYALYTARKAAKMTQAKLAELLGVNRATISKYETGSIVPTIDQIIKISEILNVSILDLLGMAPEGDTKEDRDLLIRLLKEYARDHGGIDASTLTKVYYFDENGLRFRKDGDLFDQLIKLFDALNPEGQTKAVERVEELTEIPKYQKPHD